MKHLKLFEIYSIDISQKFTSIIQDDNSIIIVQERGKGNLNMTETIVKELQHKYQTIRCSNLTEDNWNIFTPTAKSLDTIILDDYNRTPGNMYDKLNSFIINNIDNTTFIILCSDINSIPIEIQNKCQQF